MKKTIIKILACICALLFLVGCTSKATNSTTDKNTSNPEISTEIEMKEKLAKLFEKEEEIFTKTASAIDNSTAPQTNFQLIDRKLVIKDSLKNQEKKTNLTEDNKKQITKCLKTMEKFFKKQKMEGFFSIVKHGSGMITYSFSDNYESDDCNEIDYNILYISNKNNIPEHLNCTKIKNKWYSAIMKINAE